MQHIIRNFFHRASTAINVLFGTAKQIDYKTLSRYMLEISQKDDLDGIMHAASSCLKDILNYRLFALVLKNEDRLSIWIDPSIYQAPFKQIIEKDFSIVNEPEIHFFREDIEPSERVISFKNEDLHSYVLMNDRHYAKLYVLPNRPMLSYHGELINIIIKTLGVSLSNYLNIRHLQSEATFDPLTNCYNRRELDRIIAHNLANAKRYDKDLSIIMLDIDHFKNINDTYGHNFGDKVLKGISNAIQMTIRKSDYLARYGGEEFIVVLPETRFIRAMELAERLRRMVENMVLQTAAGQSVQITASFGVSAYKNQKDEQSVIQEADAMLYKAKANGRNRVMPQLILCEDDSNNLNA